ncbi:DUF1735 and LamG domain-containing protein [Prevotella sp. kh1p2]|uniref:DUF1735 and LamG domain-containing protein n=1 Tax=Prevotella sp. kh1p2 TaxID=1761883 RepID=UPI0008C18DD5|nr:DUF1735 and LamG domain-containing protein [Prevotella sp. kh1p2]SES83942.1 protein of unknown function [Prevotella sp. kh1p2]SNU10782.1 protein of unknown function [Prevotellaceae bacterium KH2P17]
MKKYLFFALTILLGLTGCKDTPDFGDAVFVTGTLSSANIRFLVDGQSSMALTVSSSAKATSNVDITISADPGKLASYNATTGRQAILPPEGSYSLSSDKVTIEAGKAQSSSVEITADADKLQEGQAYCLPVSITKVSGGDLDVLEASRTAYIVFSKVINIKAADLNKSGSFDIPGFAGEASPVRALSSMTLEMKIKPESFGGISSLVGCEENFLFRFGDGAGNPDNKLQLAKASIGTPTHPDKKDHYEAWADDPFDTGRWHHFAAVYDGTYLRTYLDGVQIQSVETKGGTINLSMAYDGHSWDDTFAIGRSVGHQRLFDGLVSECRVWNVARTQAQLQDGICYVDPKSEGLIAYWRFNGQLQDDGTVLDETGHGYNAHPWGNIQWVDNQKCPF